MVNKIDQIKLALKVSIEEHGPLLIHEKAKWLKLSNSQVSKILGRQKLPPLQELLRLEQIIGVEIINVVLPDSITEMKDEQNNDFFSGPTKGFSSDLPIKSLYSEMPPDTQIKLKEVIGSLKVSFSSIIIENNLRFVERAKSAYVSINLLPEISNINNTRGIHLLFFRYYQKNDVLRAHFIIPNKFFLREIKNEGLGIGRTQTTYSPLKRRGSPQKYTFPGQPYLDMGSRFSEFKDKVIRLSLRVFEIQSSASPDGSE